MSRQDYIRLYRKCKNKLHIKRLISNLTSCQGTRARDVSLFSLLFIYRIQIRRRRRRNLFIPNRITRILQ